MTDNAKVQIINTALFQLGQEPVADLSDESLEDSLAAVKVLRVIDEARDTVLQRHGWLCALTYTTLTPGVLQDYVNWKYPYVYVLPGDALHVWEINDCPITEFYASYWRQRWEFNTVDTDIGATKIICAANPNWPSYYVDQADPTALKVSYVRRCSYDALTPHLRDAIAFDAAARSARSVTGDAALAKGLEARAAEKVLMAVSTDAKQIEGEEPYAPSIPQMIRNYSR